MASKDLLLGYYAMNNQGFRKILNAAAHVMDVKMPDVKTMVVDAIYAGKTNPPNIMDAGKRYYKDFVVDKTRIIAARKAEKILEDEGIRLGTWSYLNAERKGIEFAIKGNKKIIELDVNNALNSAHLYAERLKKTIDYDYLSASYGWTRYVIIEPIDELQPAADYAVRLGMSENILRMERQIGLGQRQDETIFNPVRLLNFLKQDGVFPRYITVETIMKQLSNIKLVDRPDLMEALLIGMGASALTARQAVSIYLSKGKMFTIYLNSRISRQDSILPILDYSERNIHRMIKVMDAGLETINTVLYELALALQADQAQYAPVKRYRCRTTDTGRAEIMNALRLDTKYDGLRYMGLFK